MLNTYRREGGRALSLRGAGPGAMSQPQGDTRCHMGLVSDGACPEVGGSPAQEGTPTQGLSWGNRVSPDPRAQCGNKKVRGEAGAGGADTGPSGE